MLTLGIPSARASITAAHADALKINDGKLGPRAYYALDALTPQEGQQSFELAMMRAALRKRG